MTAPGTDILTRARRPRLHNRTEALNDTRSFRTSPAQWSYSVSFSIDIARPDAGQQLLVLVDVHVTDGAVGVGLLDARMEKFVTSEVDAAASAHPRRIELRPQGAGGQVHLMFRNIAASGPSCFQVRGAELQIEAAESVLLKRRTCPVVPATIHTAVDVHASFDIFVSHTSRRWLAEQCDRGYLERRYADSSRLQNVPPLESLPPNVAPYHGLLSVFRLEIGPGGVAGSVLQHYVSDGKVVHAAVVGDTIIVCFDAGISAFSRRQGGGFVDVEPTSERRVADPWFGGLHTVIAVDERHCLVSSSGADAILWLDTVDRLVTRRWRLPASHYGTNYALDETTWLREHYIPNDLQLGHLNCAAPDGGGGAFFSVLGQGDIGHVDERGATELLVRGQVGCHGVRYSRRDGMLYFSDSCGGRLMRVDGPGRTTTLVETGSRWLHDAVRLTDTLFLLVLGDQNRLVLADTRTRRFVAEWDFSGSDGTVQFVSVAAARRLEAR